MLLPYQTRYVEDFEDAKRNRITLVGGFGGPVYTAVLAYSFSDEDLTECVTLEEIKRFCFIDGNDYDALILDLLPSVRNKLENKLNKSLINRTVTATVKPGTRLPFGPVKEILSITSLINETETFTDYDSVSTEVIVVYTAGFEIGQVPEAYKLLLKKLLKAELPTL